MSFTSTLPKMNLNYKASGGREQRLQSELNELQRPYDQKYRNAFDSLQKRQYKNEAQKAALQYQFDRNQDISSKIYVDFGRTHIDSYLGLDIVYRNRQLFSKKEISQLIERLPDSLKESSKAKALITHVSEDLATTGEKFIDFTAKTLDDKTFKLSSLQGKYIFLSFGSASCVPCKEENKQIAAVNARLFPKINFVYFSLDKNKDDWEKMSKSDRITWYNISDLEGSTGKIKTKYNVQAMPTSFLIDPKGFILKRYIGYNPDFVNDIESVIRGAK